MVVCGLGLLGSSPQMVRALGETLWLHEKTPSENSKNGTAGLLSWTALLKTTQISVPHQKNHMRLSLPPSTPKLNNLNKPNSHQLSWFHLTCVLNLTNLTKYLSSSFPPTHIKTESPNRSNQTNTASTNSVNQCRTYNKHTPKYANQSTESTHHWCPISLRNDVAGLMLSN